MQRCVHEWHLTRVLVNLQRSSSVTEVGISLQCALTSPGKEKRFPACDARPKDDRHLRKAVPQVCGYRYVLEANVRWQAMKMTTCFENSYVDSTWFAETDLGGWASCKSGGCRIPVLLHYTVPVDICLRPLVDATELWSQPPGYRRHRPEKVQGVHMKGPLRLTSSENCLCHDRYGSRFAHARVLPR